jgi:deoxyribodipyrimidine photolyase-related protein
MAEDVGLCTYERHHQQKIVLFLAAMRAYADELRNAGYDVDYVQLDTRDTRPYEARLEEAMNAAGAAALWHFEVEDKAMEGRIVRFAASKGIDRREITSPMFTCTREEFARHAAGRQQLLMAEFYKWRRRELGILVDEDGAPTGGRWSYDADNRKRLPRGVEPPAVHWPEPDRHVPDVIELVAAEFPDHPGNARDFRWPTTRKQVLSWLDDFIRDRLAGFGPYEDAMTSRSDTLFHSLLSPYLNMGLLTPHELVERVSSLADQAPIQSVEGLVRQVIGWREFVRGVYRELGDDQEKANFWQHERELTGAWYEGSTGVPPLDDAIRTVQRLGWTHHIPRLMILGNLMTLCEIRPPSAHRWFMEMFVYSVTAVPLRRSRISADPTTC